MYLGIPSPSTAFISRFLASGLTRGGSEYIYIYINNYIYIYTFQPSLHSTQPPSISVSYLGMPSPSTAFISRFLASCAVSLLLEISRVCLKVLCSY